MLTSGRDISVLGPDQKLHISSSYRILSNGEKSCWRLTTKLGRTVVATSNHPFLTDKGWKTLGVLEPGHWIAVPSRIHTQVEENDSINDDELKLLAFFIADGGIGYGAAVFTKEDPVLVDEFRASAEAVFPELFVVPSGRYRYRVSTCQTGVKNQCIRWLKRHGLMGKTSAQKKIPTIVFSSSLRQISLFLSRLFACDGWYHNARQGSSEIGYCSASFELAEGIKHLLLRFGIVSSLRSRDVGGKPYWNVEIRSWSHMDRFIRNIGMTGIKGACLEEFALQQPGNPMNAHDRIPAGLVAPRINRLKKGGVSTVQITGSPNRRIRLNSYSPMRATVLAYAENTMDNELFEMAAADIHWDQVSEIEFAGQQPTFDLSVPEYHNFVANDIIVHNSIVLSTDALHFAFTTRGGQGLIAAPHQGHLDSIAEEIEFQLEANPDLMASIALTKYGKPKIHRKPYFRLEFTNGAILYFRPAGAYGDAFRSLHVERVWVDEGAWLTERAWKALRQCLKSGGKLRIYSTPNGMRNSTYYRLTTSTQFKVFRWPSWLNPIWSEEREAELLEFYGGRDSAGWQHEVAGEHGKPSYAAFNIEYLNFCRQELLEYQKVVVTGEELSGCDTEEESHDRLEAQLNLVPQTGVFWIGGDLGYTNDPTELVVFQELELGERRIIKLVLRVHMKHVAYPHIAQTIALLDRYYTATGIGVDNGGNGLAVVQELHTLDKYKDLLLEGRLRGYDFGGMTTLAVRDGKEIRKRTKEFMTSLINGALQRRQIVLPAEDLELEDQFTTHTYTLRDGRVIYSKGNDHIIDAVRCALLAREQANLDQVGEETVSLVPILTDPVFI
nr:LAGLIDADG family homing endonuclease [Desulfosarcina widdelii]